MKNPRAAVLGAVSAALLLLTACGGTEEGTAVVPAAPATPSSTATSEPAESSESAKPSASASAAPAGDATPPGTELTVGQTAVVPFKYGTEKTGTLGITVTAIEAGVAGDLAAFGEKAKGLVPFYIRLTVENVGGTDLAYSSVRLRALGADMRGTGTIIVGEVAGKCERATAPRDFTSTGAKYEACVLAATQEGSKVAAAEFTDSDAYKDDGVVWKG